MLKNDKNPQSFSEVWACWAFVKEALEKAMVNAIENQRGKGLRENTS
jgi:hypothetical protein